MADYKHKDSENTLTLNEESKHFASQESGLLGQGWEKVEPKPKTKKKTKKKKTTNKK